MMNEERKTCVPCETSWTAPVAACPSCGLVPEPRGGFLCNTDALTGIDKDPFAKEQSPYVRKRKG
jgi:hypothetical protein